MKTVANHRSLVSVVTVCYNVCDDLERTIKSVASQTASEIEYVVIDGGSSDGTQSIASRYQDVIDVFVSEPDNGIYDAMNKGVRLASGDFVIFMNAGDTFVASDVVERVFASDGVAGADVIYGDVVKNGVVKKAGAPVNCHRMFFCHQSCFCRRKLLLKTPFDTAHPMSADFKWVKTMIKQERRFVQLDIAIADFDTNGVSNNRRSAGLRDNIDVVCELDGFMDRLCFLPRLYLPYVISLLRGK